MTRPPHDRRDPAGFVAWLLDIGRYPTAVILPGAVVAGLGAGIFVGAWAA